MWRISVILCAILAYMTWLLHLLRVGSFGHISENIWQKVVVLLSSTKRGTQDTSVGQVISVLGQQRDHYDIHT